MVEHTDIVDEIICDKCNFKSTSKDEIRKHIENHSTPFQCEQCELFTETEENLNQHRYIHQAEIISNSLHMCPKCTTSIPLINQKIQCDTCFFFFQKKCTNRKEKGGRIPKGWICESCQVRSKPGLNVDAFSDKHTSQGSNNQ